MANNDDLKYANKLVLRNLELEDYDRVKQMMETKGVGAKLLTFLQKSFTCKRKIKGATLIFMQIFQIDIF